MFLKANYKIYSPSAIPCTPIPSLSPYHILLPSSHALKNQNQNKQQQKV